MNHEKKIECLESSGNLYADLGFPDAEERLAKLQLAMQINKLIEKKGLNQTEAAALLDIDQPKISALSQGKLAGFSLERLFRFLTILDYDITIEVTPKSRSKKQAQVSVTLPKRKSPALKQKTVVSERAVHAKKRK